MGGVAPDPFDTNPPAPQPGGESVCVFVAEGFVAVCAEHITVTSLAPGQPTRQVSGLINKAGNQPAEGKIQEDKYPLGDGKYEPDHIDTSVLLIGIFGIVVINTDPTRTRETKRGCSTTLPKRHAEMSLYKSLETIMLIRILSRIAPGITPVTDWCDEYMMLLDLRDLRPKTREKRKGHVGHIKSAIGGIRISSVRPIHVAQAVHEIWESGRQNTARRVLLEAKDMFAEAVAAGLISANPAASIKPLPVKIRRQRMRLDEWRALYDEAKQSEPAWVSRMLLLALITGQRRADLQKMSFSDIRDGHLYVEQQKTGERIALPFKLKLIPIGMTLDQVIKSCRHYAEPGETLLRKQNGQPIGNNYMSARFRDLFVRVLGRTDTGFRPTLHECRSLSERLYRDQGVNTQVLLGHKHQRMTDLYNDSRGLDLHEYKFLAA